MRLLTIPFSHYCEKARWALERAELPYTEDAYLPGLHVRPMRRALGKTVPVLVTAETTLTESTAILDHADRASTRRGVIWPESDVDREKAKALVADFDRELGVASRRLAYFHLLPHGRTFVRVVASKLSATDRTVLRIMLPLFAPLIRRRYRVDDARIAKALETVDRTFDRVADALEKNGRYLVGDTMTGADLTFAALASPLVLPPEHPLYLGELDALPVAFRDLVVRLRAHPAGRHALQMYAEDRGPPHA